MPVDFKSTLQINGDSQSVSITNNKNKMLCLVELTTSGSGDSVLFEV